MRDQISFDVIYATAIQLRDVGRPLQAKNFVEIN